MASNGPDTNCPRTYTSLACNNCRNKHRRCDGQNPCNRCSSRLLDCSYSNTKPRGGYRIKKKEIVVAAAPTNLDLSPPLSQIAPFFNYYGGAFSNTSEGLFLPFSLSSDVNELSTPERKFRIGSTLALTALTVGHVAQGNMLMDQVKHYLPQIMSSCSVDVAVGYAMLTSCHLMQLEFTPANNFLRLYGTTSATLWKTQRKLARALNHNSTAYADQFFAQCLYLKLFYYHCKTFNADSVKTTAKNIQKLLHLTESSRLEPLEAVSQIYKGMQAIFVREATDTVDMITLVESAAASLDDWNGKACIFLHFIRLLKFYILKDYPAVLEECAMLTKVYDSLPLHDSFTISFMHKYFQLWAALNLNDELQRLVGVAKRLSALYRGYQVLVERFQQSTDQTEPMSEDPLFNLFIEIISSVAQLQMDNTNHVIDPFSAATNPADLLPIGGWDGRENLFEPVA